MSKTCDFISLAHERVMCRSCGRVMTVNDPPVRIFARCFARDPKPCQHDGSMPLISIVMPVWNAARFVGQAIESILAQTEQRFELIVVNDGSDDETFVILNQLAADHDKILLVNQRNMGTGAALNAGFRLARGEYRTWWSADSWVEPNWLAELKQALDEHPEVGFVYSHWSQYYEETQQAVDVIVPDYDHDLLQKECFVGPCWLWRRQIQEKAGEFSTELCEDYDMHLRMADLTSFLKVPKVLGHWRDHSSNLTNSRCRPQNFAPSLRVRTRYNWKRTPGIRVAWIGPYFDAASVGWFLASGLNEVASDRIAVRHILGKHLHMRQTEDLLIGRDCSEIRQTLDECDLIHCNVCLPDDKYSQFDFRPWLDRGKPMIHHLHGGHWPWMGEQIARYQSDYGIRVISCTPAISEMISGAKWMPNYIPISESQQLYDGTFFAPPPHWPSVADPIRIMCHHNYSAGKGNELISVMFKWLSDEIGIKVDASVRCEKPVPLREHLEQKKGFDVCIDQITQGFIGMAGWESLAQGAVVIARLDDFAIDAYTALGHGEPPPILNARWIDEVAAFVTKLAREPDYVIDLKRQGRQWMLRHYSAERIAELWLELYQDVINEHAHGAAQSKTSNRLRHQSSRLVL